jgi:hypothetical protein
LLAALALTMLLGADGGEEKRPSVLLVTSKSSIPFLIDLRWLGELHAAGFEPDYLDALSDFTWERIRHYNTLVVFSVPSEWHARTTRFRGGPLSAEEYVALIECCRSSNHGELAFPTSTYANRTRSGSLPWFVRRTAVR